MMIIIMVLLTVKIVADMVNVNLDAKAVVLMEKVKNVTGIGVKMNAWTVLGVGVKEVMMMFV